MNESVNELIQVICVVLEVQHSILHESSHKLSGQLDEFALFLVGLWTLDGVLDHEQAE